MRYKNNKNMGQIKFDSKIIEKNVNCPIDTDKKQIYRFSKNFPNAKIRKI